MTHRVIRVYLHVMLCCKHLLLEPLFLADNAHTTSGLRVLLPQPGTVCQFLQIIKQLLHCCFAAVKLMNPSMLSKQYVARVAINCKP